MPDDKAAWDRMHPVTGLTPAVAEHLVARASPGARVERVELLPGGLCNSNYRVHLAHSPAPVVLRFYDRDPAACAREAGVMRLVRHDVPVPDLLFVEPEAVDGLPPFLIMEYVEGIRFRELKDAGDAGAIAQACHDIGLVLSRIAGHRFPLSGMFGPGLEVRPWALEGPSSIPEFVDLCVASENFRGRVDARLAGAIHAFAWSWAGRFAALDHEAHLVHADFNAPNILVRRANGGWKVAAVLDWEFAFASSPLWDVGNFLRYERRGSPLREPHFSRGCEEGGLVLPDDWRRLARAIDLSALCEILARPALPLHVTGEVVELARATVEDRDPVFGAA